MVYSRAMLLDCHAHSSRYSACSHTDPDTLCSLALERGLNGLTVTEHHAVWPDELLAHCREKYAPLRIYPGVEVSTQEGYDVVCVNPPRDFRARPFMPLSSMLKALRDVRSEVFLFVAHPFRYTTQRPKELLALLREMDGVEINSVNILRAGCVQQNGRLASEVEPLYLQTQEEWDLVPLYNTDSHHPDSVGTIANRLDVQELPKDPAALAILLRDAAPREHQNVSMLRAWLGRCGDVQPHRA